MSSLKTINALFLFLFSFSLLAKDYWVSIEKLHPTQFNVGLTQVKIKTPLIEDYFKKGDLKKYLKKKIAPVVIGPSGQLYLVDHHHLTYSLYLSNLPQSEKRLYITEIGDLSSLSIDTFWEKMVQKKWAYPYSNGEGPLDMKSLPQFVWNLSDDPYRTLAWMVQNEGAYDEVDQPFQEFIWANFFRNNGIVIDSEDDFKRVLVEATQLAKSKRAKNLPGYKRSKK